MDPVDITNPESRAPPETSTQQKRAASSPLQTDPRNVRTRNDNQLQNDPRTPTASTSTDDVTQTGAIHNSHFPVFKLLRKLNNKLVTAQHHLTFLTELQSNGQVPRGLQIKSAPTGAELDFKSYQEWEEAHILLGNTLRDILIKHWKKTVEELTVHVTELTDSLKVGAKPAQCTLILAIIDKANKAKMTELMTRRVRKQRERTAISEGERGTNQPQNQGPQ